MEENQGRNEEVYQVEIERYGVWGMVYLVMQLPEYS
jgi:hypothetical protein